MPFNPCPVSYPHLPHDYCDGKQDAYRIGSKLKDKPMPINNGGPAFPHTVASEYKDDSKMGTVHDGFAGMTLRDWFAGQALNGLISFENGERIHKVIDREASATGREKQTAKEYFAEVCYGLADAMLAERVKETP